MAGCPGPPSSWPRCRWQGGPGCRGGRCCGTHIPARWRLERTAPSSGWAQSLRAQRAVAPCRQAAALPTLLLTAAGPAPVAASDPRPALSLPHPLAPL